MGGYETPETLLRKSTVATRAGTATKTAMTSSAGAQRNRGRGASRPHRLHRRFFTQRQESWRRGGTPERWLVDLRLLDRRGGLLDQVSSDEKLTEHLASFSAEPGVPRKSRMHRERCVDAIACATSR